MFTEKEFISEDTVSRTGARTAEREGRARARGAYSQTGKQWRVRAPVAF